MGDDERRYDRRHRVNRRQLVGHPVTIFVITLIACVVILVVSFTL